MGRMPVLFVWPGQAPEDSCKMQCWPSALSPPGLKWLLAGKRGRKGLPLVQDIPAGVALLINSPRCRLPSTCQGGERRKQSQEKLNVEDIHSFIHSFYKYFLSPAACWAQGLGAGIHG